MGRITFPRDGADLDALQEEVRGLREELDRETYRRQPPVDLEPINPGYRWRALVEDFMAAHVPIKWHDDVRLGLGQFYRASLNGEIRAHRLLEHLLDEVTK